MKYKVIKGIFEGHIFNGEIAFNGERIIDNDSFGRSYPIENCILIEED